MNARKKQEIQDLSNILINFIQIKIGTKGVS